MFWRTARAVGTAGTEERTARTVGTAGTEK